MLNKENYVPWSSRLLRYAKSKPNRKLIYNSIMKGPYVRRMISKPGDPDREVPIAETFHEQTDDELTDKEVKQMEADDQAIQTILMGLSEDIYAVVDIGNGNVVAARAEGYSNGNNKNQVRCYNCRGIGRLARNCTIRPKRRDDVYLQTQLLIPRKEEARIQLQAEEFDLMDAAGDLDEIENNVISMVSNVEKSGGTVEQHPSNVEETRAYFELLYNNLVIEVKKVKTVNRKMKETNADLTNELARYKSQEKCFESNHEKYDKLERVDGFEEALKRERSRIGRNIEGNGPSKAKAKDNGRREINLPSLLAAHLGRNEDVQPLRYSLTSVHGGRSILNYKDLKAKFRSHFRQQKKFTKTHLAFHNIKKREGESVRAFATRYTDDTMQILGLHEDHRIYGFVHRLKTRNLVEHLFTDLPSTYKGLMEKTYTWIEAREFATNGALNDQRDNFKRSRKSSWDNSRGKRSRDRFSLY
nr:hypothetical protein [Tanacetum cinerariifolium]